MVAGCGGSEDTNEGSGGGGSEGAKSTLSLVAYSTPEVVYDEIIPAFRKTDAGKEVGFETSFGASGEQSRAVEGGLKEDVVSFSIEPDTERLVEAGLVDKAWPSATSTDGLVSKSIVSFIVRKGNPKNIKTWDDLVKPGVKVVTPNPFTSGAAKPNLLGAYAHGGVDYVEKLIKDNVSVQPKSGREALQTFTGGESDVLLSYEYEATTAIKKGEKEIELVRPADSTVEIEINIAQTKDARGREGVHRLRDRARGPGEVRRLGLPAGEPRGLRADEGRLPEPAEGHDHRGPRRLVEGERRTVRPGERVDRRDRGRRGGLDGKVSGAASPARSAGRALAGRAPQLRFSFGGVGALGLGVATLWLSLIVLLPLAAVVDRSFQDGLDAFWSSVSGRQAAAALRFTLGISLLVTVINAVMGTLIAWVLVRDEFRGKRAVNALIDLPFALPTIVAGLTLLALYGDAIAFKKEAVLLAMLFVTLPFVVRAVQPVLIELDREMEQAAYSLGASAAHHLQADRAAQPDAGDRVRRGAGLRPRGRRVRLRSC